MARVPYIDEEAHPELTELTGEIRSQRSGRLSHLYRMLLNSPPVTQGWLRLLTAIRRQAELPGRYRELAILRVAVVNRAPYEYDAHVPHALAAGLSERQLGALADWDRSQLFDDAERAVLAYTDAMTRNVEVADAVFIGVRALFSDRELVELTATIAAYNLVSRFLVALQIDPDHQRR